MNDHPNKIVPDTAAVQLTMPIIASADNYGCGSSEEACPFPLGAAVHLWSPV